MPILFYFCFILLAIKWNISCVKMTSWKDFSLHHRQIHYSIIIFYRRFHYETKIREIQYDLSIWFSIEGKQKIIFQDNCKLNWSNGMSYFNAHALTPANVTFISDNIFQINVSIVSDVCLKENWACTTADFCWVVLVWIRPNNILLTTDSYI